MSTFTKVLTDVNDRALAAAAAEFNSTLPEDAEPLTDHQYLDRIVSGALKSWQDNFIRIPSSEFLLRFPAGKIDQIKAAAAGNPQLAAYIEELRVNPFVYTGSDLVRGGIATLVAAGLLTQAQANVILV
jgi:hypothetical protein